MALELWMSAQGRIRLYLDVNAAGTVTAVELQADPGSAGTVTGHLRAPPAVEQDIIVLVDDTGVTRRSTFPIPVPRRWTYADGLPPGYWLSLYWTPT